ncbi:MAG: 1-deoxy-D-xylulose-5-phosphate reductoisomerase [Syntrophothermus sp.]
MKRIVLLGSTGSIGTQALEVIDAAGNQFSVVGLAAGRNVDLLEEQARRYRPRLVAMGDIGAARELAQRLADLPTQVLAGEAGLLEAATMEADQVVVAMVGAAGLLPTLAAIRAGRQVALANKETLVIAGRIVTETARLHEVRIIPVDSEHSAIFQCLAGQRREDLAGIILTASGGPFRLTPAEDLARVTSKEALQHPNWSMGGKITIDSATLMNKALEVIEAHWLFGVDYSQIRIVVHPQSIIHSMVEMIDGSVLAQLGLPDMRLPIQYALTYPNRLARDARRLSLPEIGQLTFEEPDFGKFPCLRYAIEAGKMDGTMPAVMNAANEVAVSAFLAGEIGFMDIPRAIAHVMNQHSVTARPSVEEILEADRWAREQTDKVVRHR